MNTIEDIGWRAQMYSGNAAIAATLARRTGRGRTDWSVMPVGRNACRWGECVTHWGKGNISMDGEERLQALLMELFSPLERQSPGSAESTRRAWEALPPRLADALVVDMGCGNGASTEWLLQQPGVRLIALDASVASLTALGQRVHSADKRRRVLPVAADMLAAPLTVGSCDVIWTEGAIYSVGFVEAIVDWRRWLRPGGHLVVNEAVWLTENPPPEARQFWDEAYPRMGSVADNQRFLTQAGYQLIDHFVQPASDWQDYYEPLEAQLTTWRRRQPAEDPLVEQMEAMIRREIDLWRAHGDSYGYCFFIARYD